jgi:hypothetical protein
VLAELAVELVAAPLDLVGRGDGWRAWPVSRRVSGARSVRNHTAGQQEDRPPHAGWMPALEPLDHQPGVPRLRGTVPGELGQRWVTCPCEGGRAQRRSHALVSVVEARLDRVYRII